VLCERHGIDNSGRTLHGALLDAELLAEVYLAMTRGQESLVMDLDLPPAAPETGNGSPAERVPLRVLCANEDELAAHEKLLDEITREAKGRCVWRPVVEGGAGV